jgi:methionyl aminopeptidase
MIVRKSRAELEKMRRANLIVAEVLDHLETMIKPGVSAYELDRVAEHQIRQAGGIPAFKGYRGFPASVCASRNEEIVHGIPRRSKILREGDILAVDVGVCLEGYFGDAARTFPVGEISADVQHLLDITREALYLGIEKTRVGNRVSDISATIQRHVESNGFSVVREFVGHGIGKALHEKPEVPNFGKPGLGQRLLEGMVLAIEPMVNSGGAEVRLMEDRWTAVTADGLYSAHFEHSVAVTENGPWVLSEIN